MGLSTHPARRTDGPVRSRHLRAVTFVAVLSALEGMVAMFVPVLFVAGWLIDANAMQEQNTLEFLDEAALFAISGCTLLASAVGLLRLHRWAWTLAMATQGFTLTVTLYGYLSADPDYLVMSLGVLAVLLLNRQEVRVAFMPPGSHSA